MATTDEYLHSKPPKLSIDARTDADRFELWLYWYRRIEFIGPFFHSQIVVCHLEYIYARNILSD